MNRSANPTSTSHHWQRLGYLFLLLALLEGCAITAAWVYTMETIQSAITTYGLYATPEAGMSALLYHDGRQVEAKYILSSGPSCFIVCNPNTWYIHVAGSGIGGGAYFLHTPEGWVYVPESAITELIGWSIVLFGMTPRQ